MREPNRARDAGFTIVEILVALVIAVAGIAGAFGLHITSSRASQYSRHSTEGAMLGEQKIEDLMMLPKALLSTASGSDLVNSHGVATDNGTYQRTWTIVDDGTFLIDLSVSWEEDDGRHTLNFRTRLGT